MKYFYFIIYIFIFILNMTFLGCGKNHSSSDGDGSSSSFIGGTPGSGGSSGGSSGDSSGGSSGTPSGNTTIGWSDEPTVVTTSNGGGSAEAAQPWSGPQSGQQVSPENIPMVKANVCAGVFQTDEWNMSLGRYTPQNLQDLYINLKFDYFPAHYFAYWRNQGFYDTSKNAVNLYPVPVKLTAKVKYGNITTDMVGSDGSGRQFSARPAYMNTYIYVYEGSTLPGVTWLYDIANLFIYKSSLYQAGTELVSSTGDVFLKDFTRDGNFDPQITELNVSIPTYAGHFVDIKFQNIPVRRIVQDEQGNMVPFSGCFESMATFQSGLASGSDLFRFNPHENSSHWWSRDSWIIPRY